MKRSSIRTNAINKYKLISNINRQYIREIDKMQLHHKERFIASFPEFIHYTDNIQISTRLVKINTLVTCDDLLSSDTKLKVLDEIKGLLYIPEISDEIINLCNTYLEKYKLLEMK
jgi:hypothetical protein